MSRLTFLLALSVLTCALGVVAATHQQRKRFIEFNAENERARELEQEFVALTLEQSTWSTHARVEREATTRLSMRQPRADEVRVVTLDLAPPAARATEGKQNK